MGGKISKGLKKAKSQRNVGGQGASEQAQSAAAPTAASDAPAQAAPTAAPQIAAQDASAAAQSTPAPTVATDAPAQAAPTTAAETSPAPAISAQTEASAEPKQSDAAVTAPASETPAPVTDKALPVSSDIKAEDQTGAPTATGEAAEDSLRSAPPAAAITVPTPEVARKPKIYVIIYSTWGHTKKLAEAIMKGLAEGGVEAKLWRVAETLPQEVLDKMHAAPAFEDVPVIQPNQLLDADGFLFGIPTRYGTAPTQIKTFWDATGQIWQQGGLVGKYGAVFHCTATQHGGQETTTLSFLPHFAHHGILFVPLGYTSPILHDNTEVVGGSPYGAGTIAGSDGSRQPSQKELDIGVHQGKHFAAIIGKVF